MPLRAPLNRETKPACICFATGGLPLPLYKKPTDYSRDPSTLSKMSSKSEIRVQLKDMGCVVAEEQLCGAKAPVEYSLDLPFAPIRKFADDEHSPNMSTLVDEQKQD
jgi:hypothetical protein